MAKTLEERAREAVAATKERERQEVEQLRQEIGERQRPFREARAAAAEAERARQEAERQTREQARLDALTDELRRGYFGVPGATEEGFQAALPELLEERRRRAALAGEDESARRVNTARYRNA